MTKRSSINKRVSQYPNCKIEVDYDKLADSIVKAQLKAENEKETHSKVRKSIMNFLNGFVYISISILCFYGIYFLWRNPSDIFGSLVLKIIVSALLGVSGIMMFLAQQESLGETAEESNQHFNTNLSLVALILALIALLK